MGDREDEPADADEDAAGSDDDHDDDDGAPEDDGIPDHDDGGVPEVTPDEATVEVPEEPLEPASPDGTQAWVPIHSQTHTNQGERTAGRGWDGRC